MSDNERDLSEGVEESPVVRLVYEVLGEMGETELRRMMKENEIGLASIDSLSTLHKNGVLQERFHNVLSEENPEEGRAFIGLIVSGRLMDFPRHIVFLRVAELVGDVDAKLEDFEEKGLVLQRIEGLDQIKRMMAAEGLLFRNS